VEKLTKKNTTEQIPKKKQEAIEPNLSVGDVVLTGRYKNKRVEVKKIETDELGQPTVNGMKALAFRIEKLMPKEKWSQKSKDELKENIRKVVRKFIKQEQIHQKNDTKEPKYTAATGNEENSGDEDEKEAFLRKHFVYEDFKKDLTTHRKQAASNKAKFQDEITPQLMQQLEEALANLAEVQPAADVVKGYYPTFLQQIKNIKASLEAWINLAYKDYYA